MTSPRLHRRSRLPARLVLLGIVSLVAFSAAALCRHCSGGRHALVQTGQRPQRRAVAVNSSEAAISSSCDNALHGARMSLKPKLDHWRKVASRGQIIEDFHRKATDLLSHAQKRFDRQVVASKQAAEACASERAILSDQLQKEMHSIFLTLRASTEESLYQRLRKQLLRQMWWKRRELEVTEKLRLLHLALQDYDEKVQQLQPPFVEDSDRVQAERRLSDLQWSIHEAPEAKDMLQRWRLHRLRRSPARPGGVSVSMSPGVRLMFRPQGFGNLQFWSRRPIGSPHNPGEISIGVLNDGHISDIYNQKDQPPSVKFQPTLGLQMRIGQ